MVSSRFIYQLIQLLLEVLDFCASLEVNHSLFSYLFFEILKYSNFFLLVFRLLKIADNIRILIHTVLHALCHIGDLSVLFGLLFFIFSILGVELFGHLSNFNIFNLYLIQIEIYL
jgi:hypothetical protein